MTRRPQRPPTPETEGNFVLERLMAFGPGAPDDDEKQSLMQMLRGSSPEQSQMLDAALIRQLGTMHGGIENAREVQAELRAIVEKMSSTPWHPAVVLRTVEAPMGQRVLVWHGGSARLVDADEEVDIEELRIGDPVYLSHELNLVMATAPADMLLGGDTACFERITEDGRLLLKSRDEELVVTAVASLDVSALETGDTVRWDRGACLALEWLPQERGRNYLLDEVDHITADGVGGQAAALESLTSALTAKLIDPELANLYDLSGRQAVLLSGPPGCGKTLMVRTVAAELQRLTGRSCKIAVVSPGEFETPWVGETERNIRACFEMLKKEAGDDLAVLVLDEIESVGRIRGGFASHLQDKFLNALLTALDGFSDRGNVALVCCTNRTDLLDPALLERISDVDIEVPRPSQAGARAIFEVHLREGLPYDDSTGEVAEVRAEMIDAAVSTLYAPNAENQLCTVHFRDGSKQRVVAREVLSGRVIAQICRAARDAAFLRHRRGGTPGLQTGDLDLAVAATLSRLRSTLTVHNIAAHLDGLPPELDVVRVEQTVPRVERPTRYLHAV